MPSQRKRIGFLPSEEVHEIIDKICRANKFSQSKVTGLLVEEALRFRGMLGYTLSEVTSDKDNFLNDYFEEKPYSLNSKSTGNRDIYAVNKKLLSDDIKMMHEFIEFKYFKKIMMRNHDLLE